MSISFRRVIFRLCSILFLPLGLWAAGIGHATATNGLPNWIFTATIDTAVGYKDNLLLSHAAEERSAFGRYGVELFLLRVPQGRIDYSFLLDAQDTRFFSGEALDHEFATFTQGQWRYRIDDRFRFAFDLVGFYLDEVRDVSDTDVQRLVAEIKVRGVNVGPVVRWSPRPWGWVEVQAVGKRELYRDGLYDAKIGEGAARIGWKPFRRLELSAGAMERRRRYDRRQQYSVGGSPIDDTRLEITEREAEGRLTLGWGVAQRLRTSFRASVLDFVDNGHGYFDFRQRKIGHVLEWQDDNWELDLEIAAQRQDYRVQVVGFGLHPPSRIADEYLADLRVERKISSEWSAYVGYRWERSRSNDPLASYRVNEGLLGARWSWEK